MGVRIAALDPSLEQAAQALSLQLSLPLQGDAAFELQLTLQGLQLQELNSKAGAVRVDFAGGAQAHRRQFGGGSGQMIAKAIGVQPGVRPLVLEATAGLGRDAFVLACLGCPVVMIERHPVVAALLGDGLRRAAQDASTAEVIGRMQLLQGDAIDRMQRWQQEQPQVIHLDPMFPERGKSAQVKKEMRLFQPLVGSDDDAPRLLAAALELASHRVVVKRPRIAPPIEGPAPGYSLQGKSSRYDIYPKKTLRQV